MEWSDLAECADRLGSGRALVLHTGWERALGLRHLPRPPAPDRDAARRLVATGVRTAAIDAPSLDETALDGDPEGGFAAHGAVLGAGGVIVENCASSQRCGRLSPCSPCCRCGCGRPTALPSGPSRWSWSSEFRPFGLPPPHGRRLPPVPTVSS